MAAPGGGERPGQRPGGQNGGDEPRRLITMERSRAHPLQGFLEQRVARVLGVPQRSEQEPAAGDRDDERPARSPREPAQRRARAEDERGAEASAHRPRQHHRTLEQDAGGEGGVHQKPRAARGAALGFVHHLGPQRRDAQRQGHVEDDVGRHHREQRRRRQHQTHAEREGRAGSTQREIAHHPQHQRCGKRCRQSRGPRNRSGQTDRERRRPEQPRRLVEIRHPGELRDQEVMRRRHLARHLGVAAFVRIDERVGASQEQAQRQAERRDDPAQSCAPREREAHPWNEATGPASAPCARQVSRILVWRFMKGPG